MRRRLGLLVLQLLLVAQASAISESTALATVHAPDATPAPSLGRHDLQAGAGGCHVIAGPGGGILSACPDAASYADFVDGLSLAMDQLRGSAATSQLSVTSEPAGARVDLNGLPAGVTPLQASVPAGTYLVRLTEDGYVPASTTVTVAGGSPGAVSRTLTSESQAEGSYFWLHPSDLAGAGDITAFVRDKDGNLYISFLVGGPGVARSTDGGHTWTRVVTLDRDQRVVSLIPRDAGGMGALVATLDAAYQDPGTTYTALTLIDLVTGNVTPVTVNAPASAAPVYQASYGGVDVFLAYEDRRALDPAQRTMKAFILRSTDGGKTLNVGGTLVLPARPTGGFQWAQVRIGPDGTRYVIDHEGGRVFIIDNGQTRLLGAVPASLKPAGYGAIDAQFDSAGNVHAAYISQMQQPAPADVSVTYQFFPREPVPYDSVALFTQPDCDACDRARDFLQEAGVAFTENSEALSSDVQASVTSAITSAGYPVLARIGADTLVSGGADVGTIGRLLGVSYTLPVASFAPRLGAAGTEDAQWAYLVMEDDEPHIVTERADGIGEYTPAIGDWSWQKLWEPPPVPQDSPTAIPPKPLPMFPGTRTSGPYMSDVKPADIPFNTISRVSDLTFFYSSDVSSVGGVPGQGFTLHSIKRVESNAYRAVAGVSQLIPSAVFSIYLGESGQPSPVGGELAPYVTQEGVVTVDGERLDRVTVDLRAQNETAQNGDLQARSIGGYVNVDIESAGLSETRQVSLILLVQNTRLRSFDAGTPEAARDITTEAVHFTGDADHWVVTNNIALPNSIPCGEDQALLLDPSSVSTFTASAVASWEIGSCLDALEVQPTVIAGCSSWEDAKLVLAAQTIDSYAQSLPLLRTDGVTNYETAFGTTDATVRRIVSVDDAAPPGEGTCASDVTGSTAAVVEISGRILGGDEAYQPRISIVDEGTAAVRTAPSAPAPDLAWEHEWLDREATFLEETLRISLDDESLASVLNLSWSDKRDEYHRELLATRALLHCNAQGADMAAVERLIERVDTNSGALLGTAFCLQDFVLRPWEYWPTYDLSLWGNLGISFLGSVIERSLSSNPTLAFLAADSTGDPLAYGQFIIARAAQLERQAGGSVLGLASDFELDHYTRLLTATAAELGGIRGAITKAVLLAGPVERDAVRTVISCAHSYGTQNPFPDLFRLTSTRNYAPGIPCVDGIDGTQARVDGYHRLAVGLRSGLFGGLSDAAGRDLDLLYRYLDLAGNVLDEVRAAEGRYPEGTPITAWNPSLPALDRFVIVRRSSEEIVRARGHQLTWGDASKVLAGFTECGVGVVRGLFSVSGLLLLGLGVGAVAAGPGAAAVGGLVFVTSGAAFSGLSAYNLDQAWESLDLQEKTAGVCGTLVTGIMAAAGIRDSVAAVGRWSASTLRTDPPKVIDMATTPTAGSTAALSADEQAAALQSRGGTLQEEPRPPPSTLTPDLATLLESLPLAKRSRIAWVADDVGYASLGVDGQAVFSDMAHAYGQDGGVSRALALRLDRITSLGGAARQTWIDTGGAVAIDLMPGRPRSLAVEVTPGGVTGSDASLVLSAAGDGFAPEDLTGSTQRGIGTGDLQASISALKALLSSDRMLNTLRGSLDAPLDDVEAAYLARVRAAALPGARTGFLAQLAQPRIVAAMRQGVSGAERLANVPAGTRIESVECAYTASGLYKTTLRVRITFQDAAPVDVAVKKGVISDDEFNLLVKLGDKGLTQRPLVTSLVDHVDGAEALTIEEFVPGKTVQQALGDSALLPGLSAALGKLDAGVFLRTLEGSGVDARALYNKDLHWQNVKVYLEGGQETARAIDFDPRFTVQATQDQYFAASLMRRTTLLQFAVTNLPDYLQGIVDAYAADADSSRSAALSMLRRTSERLRVPADRAQDLTVQSFPSTIDVASKAASLADQIDAFLAGQQSERDSISLVARAPSTQDPWLRLPVWPNAVAPAFVLAAA
jgi:PEGA domain